MSPPPASGGTAPRWPLLAFGVALLAVVALAGLALTYRTGDLTFTGGGQDSPRLLGNTTMDGTVGGGFAVMGETIVPVASDPPAAFTPPEGTGRIVTIVAWTPGAACCDSLRVLLQQQVAGGEWVTVADEVVVPDDVVDATVDLSSGGTLRYRLFPVEGSVSSGQDYMLNAQYWSG